MVDKSQLGTSLYQEESRQQQREANIIWSVCFLGWSLLDIKGLPWLSNQLAVQNRATAPIQPDFEVNPPLPERDILAIVATQRNGKSQVFLIDGS